MQELIAKESGTYAGRVLLDQADMDWIPEVMDEREYIKVQFSSPTWNPQLMSEQTWDENSRTVLQVQVWHGLFEHG